MTAHLLAARRDDPAPAAHRVPWQWRRPRRFILAKALAAAGLAALAPRASAAVVIDAAQSTYTWWAAVSPDGSPNPSGYSAWIPPDAQDGGLPMTHRHTFLHPLVPGNFPFDLGQGRVESALLGVLQKAPDGSVTRIAVRAESTSQFTRGSMSTSEPYAFGLGHVRLRLVTTTGQRLRLTAEAEHVGALCSLVIEGSEATFELRGTATLQRTFIFPDGVANVDWAIRSEINFSSTKPLDEPAAEGTLTLTLEEVGPPGAIIAEHPASASVVAGSPLTLHVSAQAPDVIAYQWFHDGVAVPGATSADFTLPSAQPRHAGNYTVRATSEGIVTTSEVATVAVSAPAPSSSRLLNLSTRGLSLAGEHVLIPGFVIAGTGNKRLLVRAVGPTLGKEPYHLPGVVQDPRILLRRFNGSTYVDHASNDDWGEAADAPAITAAAAQVQAFPFNDPAEAALLLDLAPGQYTVVADGAAASTGLAIVELYDLDAAETDSRLVNLSTRGFAAAGDGVMIPGFVISAEGSRTVLIRAVGPTLAGAPYHVGDAMADPVLTVYQRQPDGTDLPLFSSDDWGDFSSATELEDAAEHVHAFALAPGSHDAALVVTLPPGVYTAIGASADGASTGVLLVEVYVVE